MGELRAVRVRSRALTVLIAVFMVFAVMALAAPPKADAVGAPVTWLSADDFTYGTYIIDKPGTYRLAEDISFNPNSPATLTAAVESGLIPADIAAALELPTPVDAYKAGTPLFTQLLPGGTTDFAPGGPLTPLYDPAAYGVGFFAAIAISADDVTLDLNGHTIEQSAEHALLQRFFAVIEVADQPFVPGQGPSGFGDEIDPAVNLTIKNGTIGRSSHHGIHGNGNENVTISNVDFDGYEVAAVALNGVDGLEVKNVTATNRKDVPVLGTFSSGQFIKHYIDQLARMGSTTTLTVDGAELGVTDIKSALRDAINNTHHDIIVTPNIVDGRAQIDAAAHPDEYALFHNPFGVIDGNSYSFLVNSFGVAVNGFPSRPDGVTSVAAENITFRNVHVVDQHAFINEVVALDVGGAAAIDPVGAVFQVKNMHPDSGVPVTVSATDDVAATYTGNAVANAQALVAKANANGEFDGGHLDVTRLNISSDILGWVEGASGSETLADIGASYLCNGDSMFHVNKGVIAFNMDAAKNVKLIRTSVDGLANLGAAGSTLCGDYSAGVSHPAATLPGYGGAITRGYTFAGSENVTVIKGSASGLSSQWGSAVGFDVLTDSENVNFYNSSVSIADGGWGGAIPAGSPTAPAEAIGFQVGADVGASRILRGCATGLVGYAGIYGFYDIGGHSSILGTCAESQ